jgi:hypothetical protein
MDIIPTLRRNNMRILLIENKFHAYNYLAKGNKGEVILCKTSEY